MDLSHVGNPIDIAIEHRECLSAEKPRTQSVGLEAIAYRNRTLVEFSASYNTFEIAQAPPKCETVVDRYHDSCCRI